MNIKEIKEIIELMKQTHITEFEIERNGLKIVLKRTGSGDIKYVAAAEIPVEGKQIAGKGEEEKGEVEDNLAYIVSPMVGTFYAASSPDAASYVLTGDQVNEGTVVCIVEAMKVMNEIKADIRGRIKEILVKNGDAVEYDQPLFAVEKSS